MIKPSVHGVSSRSNQQCDRLTSQTTSLRQAPLTQPRTQHSASARQFRFHLGNYAGQATGPWLRFSQTSWNIPMSGSLLTFPETYWVEASRCERHRSRTKGGRPRELKSAAPTCSADLHRQSMLLPYDVRPTRAKMFQWPQPPVNSCARRMEGLKFSRPSRPYCCVVAQPQAACEVRGLVGPCATRFAMCAKCFLKSLTSSYQDTRRILEKQFAGPESIESLAGSAFAVKDVPCAESCKLPPCTIRGAVAAMVKAATVSICHGPTTQSWDTAEIEVCRLAVEQLGNCQAM